MIYVFTPQITPRINYIFEWFLGELVGCVCHLTDDPDYFRSQTTPKISYAPAPLDDELWFASTPLLVEESLQKWVVEVLQHEGTAALFRSGGILPFDPFAAAFYLVSRYEEYLPHEKDKHGRYPATAGIAKRHGFLGVPVIDKWAMMVRRILTERFPQLTLGSRQYSFTPTYDVDIAWAYKHKGLLRTIGGYADALRKERFSDIRRRTSALLGGRDPYDTVDFIDELTERHGHHPVWFFHVGKHGPFDKSIRSTHPRMQKLILRVASKAVVGVHPSYGSNKHPERVAREKQQLEKIIGQPVTRSRQHFLVMSMPETYRRLIQLGITDEYSMGYSSDLGFRAGTCSPFLWYDLLNERKTMLRVHPFAIMDATMQYFDVKVRAEEAPGYVEPIVREVRHVNGRLMTLFHNNSFSERDEWVNWRNAYERIVEMCTP